jgi:hypothetical protein
MIIQKKGEPRAHYPLRVAAAFIEQSPMIEGYLINYDGATCDGGCLWDDIHKELDSLDFFEGLNDKYKDEFKLENQLTLANQRILELMEENKKLRKK